MQFIDDLLLSERLAQEPRGTGIGGLFFDLVVLGPGHEDDVDIRIVSAYFLEQRQTVLSRQVVVQADHLWPQAVDVIEHAVAVVQFTDNGMALTLEQRGEQ